MSDNHEQSMTEKQKYQINKRILCFGLEAVQKYTEQFFGVIDISCLTKQQAQKIITGMPILNNVFGVYGRDFKTLYH